MAGFFLHCIFFLALLVAPLLFAFVFSFLGAIDGLFSKRARLNKQ